MGLILFSPFTHATLFCQLLQANAQAVISRTPHSKSSVSRKNERATISHNRASTGNDRISVDRISSEVI